MTGTHSNIRLGNFTSSEIGKLMKSGKSKDKVFGDTAMTYILEKAAEVLTGERKPQANSASIEWGVQNEMDALFALKARLIELRKYDEDEFIFYGGANFKYFEYNNLSGGSPDGVTTDAVIEVKNPYTTTNHIEALIGSKSEDHNAWLKEYNELYYAQVQWNMVCCDFDRAWWASYDSRMIDKSQKIAILSITRDEPYIAILKDRLDKAIAIVKNLLTQLK